MQRSEEHTYLNLCKEGTIFLGELAQDVHFQAHTHLLVH